MCLTHGCLAFLAVVRSEIAPHLKNAKCHHFVGAASSHQACMLRWRRNAGEQGTPSATRARLLLLVFCSLSGEGFYLSISDSDLSLYHFSEEFLQACTWCDTSSQNGLVRILLYRKTSVRSFVLCLIAYFALDINQRGALNAQQRMLLIYYWIFSAGKTPTSDIYCLKYYHVSPSTSLPSTHWPEHVVIFVLCDVLSIICRNC